MRASKTAWPLPCPEASRDFGTSETLEEPAYAAFVVDLQRRGKSDGERFYVEKFDDYVANVATFVAMVRSRAPALPSRRTMR